MPAISDNASRGTLLAQEHVLRNRFRSHNIRTVTEWLLALQGVAVRQSVSPMGKVAIAF